MKWAAFCLDLLILAALGGCGAFAVYTGLAARRWTALRKNPFLYPVGLSPEDCLDPKGFLRFIRPRVLVFGVLCLTGSAALAVSRFALPELDWLETGSFCLVLLAMAVYGWQIRQAGKRFW